MLRISFTVYPGNLCTVTYKALPEVITPECFTRMALSALNTTPKLAECTQMSFLAALMNAAQLGLEPNTPLGQAYLNHQEVEPLHPNSRRQWQFCGTRDAKREGRFLYTNIIEWAIIKMKGENVMPDDIRNIVYKFSLQLRNLLGSSLSKVILYGSYARGDNHDHSDVDVMILVKMTDTEIKRIENDVYDMAFEIEIETGIDISPIIKNEEQYEYWVDTLPFYRNVRDEGVVING